ncbi:HD domain-containing phosphohydrolase [Vibrio maerlii]|uniref:HD domain-containing phosphohydrolase n=1 Tax=Vibrio maerlii TaxID=2231648 RepID=UPI000E3D605E|nr:HD domain-containing phosphohydrolase [Vibrio maerlii]
MKQKVSIRVTVGGMFIVATILTAAIAIGLQYYFTKQMVKEHVLSRYKVSSTAITDYINKLDFDASYTTSLLTRVAHQFSDERSQEKLLPIFTQALSSNNQLYSAYIGGENEDFYQLINLHSSNLVRERIGALRSDRWVVVKHIELEGERQQVTEYYDAELNLRASRSEPSNYFPTQRPWFAKAKVGEIYQTEPYLFQNLKVNGQTYSQRIPNSNGVLGVDIVLSSITSKIGDNTRVNEGSRIAKAYLFDKNGEIIATNQTTEASVDIPNGPTLALDDEQKQLIAETQPLKVSNQNDWDPIDFTQSGLPKGYAIDLLNIVSQSTGLKFEYINGRTWNQLFADYEAGKIDMLQSLQQHQNYASLGLYSEPMYQLPFGLLTPKGQPAVKSLDDWNGKKLAMLEGWSILETIKQEYPQFEIVTFDSLYQAFIAIHSGEVDGILDSAAILRHKIAQNFYDGFELNVPLNDLASRYPPSFHLVMKQDAAPLIEIINLALANISEEQKAALKSKWFEAEAGRPSAAFSTTVPYKEVLELSRDSTQHNVLHNLKIDGQSQYLFVTKVGHQSSIEEYFAVIIPESLITSAVHDKLVTSIVITTVMMACLLPLAWIFGSPIVNPISLIRQETLKIKERRYSELQPVDTQIKELWELSTSINQMATQIREHEVAQEEFIEAIIKLIAEAIDEKSPYTGGHCHRVPKLGIMLAEAVEASTEGKFKDFQFANQDERREFRIAAWLHDCGKITTPEHIIDKGSKLEANYNRINEVRMRFEVLWRDAEIDMLKALQANSGNEQELKAKLDSVRNQLVEDFTFIANANVGGEFMSDDKIERIQTLAKTTWVRHFDDRLGLSPAEDLAITAPSTPVPAVEQLLTDKPEHIIPRQRNTDYDPTFGIKMDVPEHQYNQGEVYNLTVRRGTLTNEDRFKINEHIISTIKMLESLPFPSELKRVPRYASTHHETLKGTGYPRKLAGDELSIPERILVISDIFEALTASDRPYKKAKPISIAIDIMYKMALDEHFDIDLFRLFLTSGTYLRYAKAYLPERQIDEVEIEKYLES